MNNESELGMSSDSKYRLSMTPNTNNLQVPETRYTQMLENQANKRVVSDLSNQVVISNNVVSELQNPFENEFD